MKFARYVLGLERDCPPEWHGRFLRYKELKKRLKPCEVDQSLDSGEEGEEQSPSGRVRDRAAAEEEWFENLQTQLDDINRHFEHYARQIIAEFNATERRRQACCFVFRRRAALRTYTSLAQRAYWCRKFSKVNAVALRKILKKHDKRCRNSKGRAFLARCWRIEEEGGGARDEAAQGEGGGREAASSEGLGAEPVPGQSSPLKHPNAGAFLHSPLLAELQAVQMEAMERLPKDLLYGEADSSSHRGAAAPGSLARASASLGGLLGEAAPMPRPLPPELEAVRVSAAFLAGDQTTLAETLAMLDVRAGEEGSKAREGGEQKQGEEPSRPADEAPDVESLASSPPPSQAAPLSIPPPAKAHGGRWSQPWQQHSPGALLSPRPIRQRSAGPAGPSPLSGLSLPHRERSWAEAGSVGTSASMRRSCAQALAAVCESPSFLLDTSDAEWAADDGAATPRLESEREDEAGGVAGLGTSLEAAEPRHRLEAAESRHRLEAAEPRHRLEAAEPRHRLEAAEPRHRLEAAEPRHPPASDASTPHSPPPSLPPVRTAAPPGTSPNVPKSASSSLLSALGSKLAPAPPPASAFRDSDLTCSICLELMYKPVGLSCGHNFCKRCALGNAGFGRALGSFARLAGKVSARAACPECRQRDVYRRAVSLKSLGAVIARRHPEETAARLREEKERERRIQEEALAKDVKGYRPVLHAASAYELIF